MPTRASAVAASRSLVRGSCAAALFRETGEAFDLVVEEELVVAADAACVLAADGREDRGLRGPDHRSTTRGGPMTTE